MKALQNAVQGSYLIAFRRLPLKNCIVSSRTKSCLPMLLADADEKEGRGFSEDRGWPRALKAWEVGLTPG